MRRDVLVSRTPHPTAGPQDTLYLPDPHSPRASQNPDDLLAYDNLGP